MEIVFVKPVASPAPFWRDADLAFGKACQEICERCGCMIFLKVIFLNAALQQHL